MVNVILRVSEVATQLSTNYCYNIKYNSLLGLYLVLTNHLPSCTVVKENQVYKSYSCNKGKENVSYGTVSYNIVIRFTSTARKFEKPYRFSRHVRKFAGDIKTAILLAEQARDYVQVKTMT